MFCRTPIFDKRVYDIKVYGVLSARMTQVKNPIKTSEKTLSILDALKELGGAGVTELATHLDLTKGTVHHHLSTLKKHEYVVKQEDTYHLGMRLFQMGEFTRQQQDLYKVARPEIDKLADQTGELANLMIEEHGRGYYLYIGHGEEAVNLDTRIGTRQYLHTSALGKAILSNLPEERVEEILDQHGLVPSTSNTVTEPKQFFNTLETISDRGIAFDGEERAEGIKCVATPITDRTDTPVGAVSVSGPANRMRGERFKSEIPELVEEAATVIGINLSYQGSHGRDLTP